MRAVFPVRFPDFLIMVLVLALVTACNPPEPVLVFVGPQSGANSSLGVEGRYGFELALKSLDWLHPPRVEYLDDASLADQSLALVTDALAKGRRIFVFQSTSGASLGSIEAVMDAGGLALSATVSATELDGRDDRFFRTALSNSVFGHALAERILSSTAPGRTPAMVGDLSNKNYVDAIEASARALFVQAGVTRFLRFDFDSAHDFSPLAIATQVQEQGDPRAVILVANPLDSARLAQNLRKVGVTAPFFLAPWGLNREFIVNAGQAGEGTEGISLVEFQKSDETFDHFASAYRELHGQEPSYFAQYGYEAAVLVHDLQAQARGIDPVRWLALLKEGYSFKGLTRTILIDAYGDGDAEIFRYTVRDGDFELD